MAHGAGPDRYTARGLSGGHRRVFVTAAVRPDRSDLLIARLNLEERLLRLDEAGATAEKLYDLTFRNPQWMEKLAEVLVAEGRNGPIAEVPGTVS